MQYMRTDGINTTAGDAATSNLGKIRETSRSRRDMLMRFGALAIGGLAFAAVAQGTLADDDDGYDDDGGGGPTTTSLGRWLLRGCLGR